MDDIVVIILTLVVAVVGLLNQQRKKKTALNAPDAENKETTDFWDMIMDEPGSSVDEEMEYAESQLVENEYVAPEVAPKVSLSPEEERVSKVNHGLKKESNKKKNRVRVEGEEFSLRKAVIYNEILNRKYS